MAEDGLILAAKDDALGNLLLAQGFGDGVRYAHSKSLWLIWNGVRWKPDLKREIYERIRQYTKRAWDAADGHSHEGDIRKMLLALYDTGRKESVLKGLSAREGIAMTGDEWDRDPYFLGFENGILDLRTRTFDPHPDPSVMVSKSVGYDWDEHAKAPIFSAFIQDILSNDPNLLEYVVTMLGYSLFGVQSEQKFWMWVGRGHNGKGALARTITHVLGDYADNPSDTLYMRTKLGPSQSSAARPDLLRLQGVRFTYMSEPPGGQFNEELLKAHTGEDTIIARDLYGKAAQMAKFPPTHKIVFLTNDPPKTEDVGPSMQRRARIIQFEQDYTTRQDKKLEPRMQKERAGIMALLTVFAEKWWADGDLPACPKVDKWSSDYIEENDPLGRFIDEACVVGKQERGQSALLYKAYEDWCVAQGETPKSQTGFGLAMSKRFEKRKTKTSNVWIGIRHKSAMEVADEG